MRLLYVFVTLSLVIVPLLLIGNGASAFVDDGGSHCSYPCGGSSFKEEETPPDKNFDSRWGETAGESTKNKDAYEESVGWQVYNAPGSRHHGCLFITRQWHTAFDCSNRQEEEEAPAPSGPPPKPSGDRAEDSCVLTTPYEWVVDTIRSVIPTFHSDSVDSVVTSSPVHFWVKVKTTYDMVEEGIETCTPMRYDYRLNDMGEWERYDYEDPNRSPYQRTVTRGRRSNQTTDEFRAVRITNPATEMHFQHADHTTGEFVAVWSQPHSSYVLSVNVVAFDGSSRTGLAPLRYHWPSNSPTEGIEVTTLIPNVAW